MKVIVKSQKDAERYCETNTGSRLAVVSITDPGQPLADIREGGLVTAVFRMSFYDLEVDMKSNGHLYPCAREKDLEGLRAYIDSLSDVDILLVHCAAGISRSAAVGAAIENYLKIEDTIWKSPNYHPNARVYRLCMKEFGMQKTEGDYRELFDMIEEY